MKNLFYMNCLDIYATQSQASELSRFQNAMDISKLRVMPLLSWDIFMSYYNDKIGQAVKQLELAQVLSFAHKFKWKNDLKAAFKARDYEALIITDKRQNIIWVNNGFTEMTGYSKTFALNKTPRFLQGEKTSLRIKNRIREKIAKGEPFKEVIVNHKKDGTAYKCEVQVLPLYNTSTTHYIAFERKVG